MQFLRQGDAKVFKKYSQMKLQMNARRWRKCTGPPTSPAFWDRRDNGEELCDSSATGFVSKGNKGN
jgi:hypothetical protein